jgi:hypothetical protein
MLPMLRLLLLLRWLMVSLLPLLEVVLLLRLK